MTVVPTIRTMQHIRTSNRYCYMYYVVHHHLDAIDPRAARDWERQRGAYQVIVVDLQHVVYTLNRGVNPIYNIFHFWYFVVLIELLYGRGGHAAFINTYPIQFVCGLMI